LTDRYLFEREIASVKRTPLDFTTPVAIGKRITDDFEQLHLVMTIIWS